MKKRNIIAIIAILITMTGMHAASAFADAARPVYIIAERCNEAGDVKYACDRGVNAVEIDLRRRSNGEWVLNRDASFYQSQYLQDFFRNEAQDERLCLVFMNVREPKNMGELCDRVHNYMDRYETNVYVIYSVSSLKNADYFAQIKNELRSNEGVCVNYEEDAAAVNKLFERFGIENCWYGYGVDNENFEKFIPLEASLDAALKLRDGSGRFKRVENWTLLNEETIEERLISKGVDAVVVENYMYDGTKSAMNVLNENAGIIRLATRDDNPFEKIDSGRATILSGGNIWIVLSVAVIAYAVVTYKKTRKKAN